MEGWIIDELRSVKLGDERLNKRFINILESLYCAPDKSIPAAFDSWGETKAAYRFFENEKINEERILAPHIASTEARLEEHETVLLIQCQAPIFSTNLN